MSQTSQVEFVCETCNTTFSSNTNLNQHRKTAKFCLRLRENSTTYLCRWCNKHLNIRCQYMHEVSCETLMIKKLDKELTEVKTSYDSQIESLKTLKTSYDSQIESLKTTYDSQIESLKTTYDSQIESLKVSYYSKDKKLSDFKETEDYLNQVIATYRNEAIALKSELKIYKEQNAIYQKEMIHSATTKTDTSINVDNSIHLTSFLSHERVSDKINTKFTKEIVLQGITATAKFIEDNLIKDEHGSKKYVCTDKARKIFKYVDNNGKRVKDIKAVKFMESVNPKLIDKACKITNKQYESYKDAQKAWEDDKNSFNWEQKQKYEYQFNTATNLVCDLRLDNGSKLVNELVTRLSV